MLAYSDANLWPQYVIYTLLEWPLTSGSMTSHCALIQSDEECFKTASTVQDKK